MCAVCVECDRFSTRRLDKKLSTRSCPTAVDLDVCRAVRFIKPVSKKKNAIEMKSPQCFAAVNPLMPPWSLYHFGRATMIDSCLIVATKQNKKARRRESKLAPA